MATYRPERLPMKISESRKKEITKSHTIAILQ